ncbi:hypothetical protein ABID08_002893 [Rhizobium binae]|uniref:Uncharacterized protein n=1 Tax=Rhizobium binae TaxID=1138190 RepID=A0ABV2MJ27_9HYPH
MGGLPGAMPGSATHFEHEVSTHYPVFSQRVALKTTDAA